MQQHHDTPRSFHASPAEALRAPKEDFLYLACLNEGTGVDQPDFGHLLDNMRNRAGE